ncbi:hypothetical protein NDN01_09130 [Sphingomonas sp. QA11]|uniref:DUF6615 family protein n=1 Tax=Sphingomonas sp. QA11 TaxID=2950605 RepID=UPI0023493A5F|nr:DUF6615 family protein [Sphingomonas sp. QA11]WCM29031.1 hypothetical protein NDN01_09130 [Sphingomonas sp. QA11]
MAFAHKKDVNVSYGEETITESNLLELRRRHPAIITLHTFGKKKEAKNGADWEWHIIGRARSFGMRVQAKRLQQDNVLKIPHVVKSTKAEQINLLIDDAKKHGLMPVYCFYATEAQRTKWKATSAPGGLSPFEFGCLLTSAHKVKAKMPKTLSAIESDCVPWHYLVDRRRFRRLSGSRAIGISRGLSFLAAKGLIELPVPEMTADGNGDIGLPTIDELNDPRVTLKRREGIVERDGSSSGPVLSVDHYRERGISKLVEINVCEFPLRDDPLDAQSET